MSLEASVYGIRRAQGSITTATTTEIVAAVASKKIILRKLIVSFNSSMTNLEWQLKESTTILLPSQYGIGPDHWNSDFRLETSVGEGLDLTTVVLTGGTLTFYIEYEIG
jgi:hypothetical protein